MPKKRPARGRPLPKPSSGAAKVKLSSHAPRVTKWRKAVRKSPSKVRLHQSSRPSESPQPPARQVPWWVFPAKEERLLPPGPGGGAGGIGGLLPPGPGPGPGPFPPGPGPFPPGPGPFPPGPGPGPGPGPFPPGPGPFPPGPGPFPPPPPPRPPLPIPIPIPIPIPGPGPFPPQPSPRYIAVSINGGFAFPGATQTVYDGYYPGITIRQALQLTGLVTFGFGGRIAAVAGIRVGGNVAVRVQYNGRIIPENLLDFPAEPYSTIGLQLYYV